MTPIHPTIKQKEAFLRSLNRSISKLSDEIKVKVAESQNVENLISQEATKREAALRELSILLDRYACETGRDWPRFSSDEGKSCTLNDEEEMLRRIEKEEFQKSIFIKEKRKRHNELQSQISELTRKKTGKTKWVLRTSNEKQLLDLKEELRRQQEAKFPGDKLLIEIRLVIKAINQIDSSRTKEKSKNLQDEVNLLETALLGEKSKLVGPLFDMACIEFVKDEREARRTRARERAIAEQATKNARRRKLEESKLRKAQRELDLKKIRDAEKRKLTRHRNFLSENSREDAMKSLNAARRKADKIGNEIRTLEQSCVRRVKQIRATRGRILSHAKNDAEIIRELLKETNWSSIPALDNAVAKLRDKKEELRNANAVVLSGEKLIARIDSAKNEVERLLANASAVNSKDSQRRGVAPRFQVNSWDDAEELALRYIKWLGFSDAKRTPRGADEGKDVEAKKCVAQVKYLATGVNRPMLQQLFGVASAERKMPIFFAQSYARTAFEWAEVNNICLFKFTVQGRVTPVSRAASALLKT
jgi:hypothetical protein